MGGDPAHFDGIELRVAGDGVDIAVPMQVRPEVPRMVHTDVDEQVRGAQHRNVPPGEAYAFGAGQHLVHIQHTLAMIQ